MILALGVLLATAVTPVPLRWNPAIGTVARYSLDFHTANTTELDAGEDRWSVTFSAGLQATFRANQRLELRSFPAPAKLTGLYGRTFDRPAIWKASAWPFRVAPTGLTPSPEYVGGGALLIFGSIGSVPGFNVVFPAQPVAVGDTWEPAVPGQRNTYVLAKLTQLSDGVATVEWSGTAAFEEPLPETMEGRYSLTRFVKFRQTSRHRVSDGTVVSATATATMRTEQLALEPAASPDGPNGSEDPPKPPEAETLSRGTVRVSVRAR
jgi:hypothetical protein